MQPGTTQSVSDATTGRYAEVNGLRMYYEIHGAGQPLVLLHGAFSAIGTSFGELLPSLAATRQVIAVELQGHGRTSDIDRPLSMQLMADDVAALVEQLGLEHVDLFGYSMGAGVALQVVIRHPELVRKLVFASGSFAMSGLHPGLMEGLGQMQPEMMHGSPWHDEYLRLAPGPDHFATFFAKKTAMDRNTRDIPRETVAAIKLPMLIILGDSNIIQPEHAVELFRLVGGGVVGDMVGLPQSQLAILPGTTHVTTVHRAGLLLAMIPPFLDTPMPQRA